ncbi:MAG: hypothetical protein BWY74_01242 [Firmicutes bacterium ADurb.Bin419]|nr:MAG: hypothetical protein BWY74_01242 [Firmicutes bacterium ADurb.Bin419]
MLNCKRVLFDIEDGAVYLNGALMSPLLKSSVKAGLDGMEKNCVLTNLLWMIFSNRLIKLENFTVN